MNRKNRWSGLLAALLAAAVLTGCAAESKPLEAFEAEVYAAVEAGDADAVRAAYTKAEEAYPTQLKTDIYRALIDCCGADMADEQVAAAYEILYWRGELDAEELTRLAQVYLEEGNPLDARDVLERAARLQDGAEAAAQLETVVVDLSQEREQTAALLLAACQSAAQGDLAALTGQVQQTDWLRAVMPPSADGVRRYTCDDPSLGRPAEVTARVTAGVPVTEILVGSDIAVRVTPETAALIRCERAQGGYSGAAQIELASFVTGTCYKIDCTLENSLFSGEASFAVHTLPDAPTNAERLAACPEAADGVYTGSFSGGSPSARQRASASTVTVGYNRGSSYYLNLDVPEGASKEDGVSALWLAVPEA